MGEATITRLVAALAYWLHEKRPGGTAPLAECHDRLLAILTQDKTMTGPRRWRSPTRCFPTQAVRPACCASAGWGNTASSI